MQFRINKTIVDTNKAIEQWRETQDSDGSNLVGRLTGSQWHFQTLYRFKSGRFFIKHSSCVSGESDSLEEVTPKEAALWLMHCGDELPEDLRPFEEELSA